MSAATYYVQSCPTCGRRLQVRVEYLGKQVVCQHCRAHFMATDPATATVTPATPLLDKVDQLLAASSPPRVEPNV